eukprot:6223597-Alexandrium_andersonii.AAC.1
MCYPGYACCPRSRCSVWLAHPGRGASAVPSAISGAGAASFAAGPPRASFYPLAGAHGVASGGA